MDRRTVYITIVVSVLIHVAVLTYVALSWGIKAHVLAEPIEQVVAVMPAPPPPPPPPPPVAEQLIVDKPRFRPRPVPPPPAPVKHVKTVPLKPQPPAESTADASTIVAEKPVPADAPSVSSTAPPAASKPPPSYPRRALEAEKEGVVQIRIIIQPSGTVSEASVVSARPEGWFETAALSAVKNWRYQPTEHISTTVVEVEFKLQ